MWQSVLPPICDYFFRNFLRASSTILEASVSESIAFNMVKAKFGDKLKSKKWTAQQNELLCKLIAHNIVVLIHEMHELGIEPKFNSIDIQVQRKA